MIDYGEPPRTARTGRASPLSKSITKPPPKSTTHAEPEKKAAVVDDQ